MASSDSERSIAGISLPQWMKNKINDRYDLDQNTFSPPTEDDSFFFIRYPKTESKHLENDNRLGSGYRNLSEVLENHTLPCQDFIPAAKSTPRELGMKRGALEPPLGVTKSTGVDDGFHSAAAACGQSVVAVAHQIIAGGKLIPRYPPRQQSSSSLDSDDEPATPPTANILTRRRGSKSLPASPQTSPKNFRKNPYFTNVLLGSSENVAEQQAKQGWLLSYVKESKSLRGSLADLAEEGQHYEPAPEPKIIKPKQKVPKPRPSQLREMNFWSPTSM